MILKWLRDWFCPTLTPVSLAEWFGTTDWEVGHLIRAHRPDLYDEYCQKMRGSPIEFGLFMDRHFPLETRWGLLGIGEIAPRLRKVLGRP